EATDVLGRSRPAVLRPAGFYRRGFTHLTTGKRPKSLSFENISASHSIAIAASCASVVRLPAVPACTSKSTAISRCLGPGDTNGTSARSSHSRKYREAASTGSGDSRTRGFVAIRRNPNIAGLVRPTSIGELSKPSHQVRAV